MVSDEADDRLLTPQQLADHLQVPLGTIYRWRSSGTGPKGCKIGRHLRYRLADVDDWLESQAS